LVDQGNLEQMFALGRRAVNDVRQTIDLATQRPELDTRNGVSLVGYSVGSWVNSVAGAADPRVRAMVLMVGGALDLPAIAQAIPQVAATDPRLALPHFGGRPVLMLNGRQDTTVPPDWARRLFAAAAEPKEQVWYDCGHLLCAEGYERAARWLEERVHAVK
ncbi:MAG TPA: alpha/beta hydrolase, partial [Humisphaera sp.]